MNQTAHEKSDKIWENICFSYSWIATQANMFCRDDFVFKGELIKRHKKYKIFVHINTTIRDRKSKMVPLF